MSQKILFDVKPVRGEWWSTLSVSNIHSEGSNSVTVKKYLGVRFNSPVKVENADFDGHAPPSWPKITADISNQQIGPSMFLVTAKLMFPGPYTFNATETLIFGIRGDLKKDPKKKEYVETFGLAADQIPAGTVNIQCAAPDKALVGRDQVLTFTQGLLVISKTVTPGTASSFQFPPGTYTVAAAELTNQDETVVASAGVSPGTITVAYGKATSLKVTYDQVHYYSAIDVTIGNISPLQKEHFHVTVMRSGHKLRDFGSPGNHTTLLRRLPPSGTIDVSVGTITLNNVQYSFKTQSIPVSAKRYQVTFLQADKLNIKTDHFVQLPIVVTTGPTHLGLITVRIVGPGPANLTYTQQVKVEAGTTNFAALVAPGKYTVPPLSFIQKGILYVVEAPTTLDVTRGTKLPLKITLGPNLIVPGFPHYLSFGGISDLTPGHEDDFVSARASSVFKYAGKNGDGDPGKYQDDDSSTVQTVELAHNVEKKLNKPMVPVMVAYTCNLSGSDVIEEKLQNKEELACSFANLILSLLEANKTIEKKHAVGYVINPDFISMCQKRPLSADYKMHVREPLQAALDNWKSKIPAGIKIPASIKDTLRGYVLAVNWLMRTIASTLENKPIVTFGWQVNLWGVGSAAWVYSKKASDDPAVIAEEMVKYIKKLGVFDNLDYRPDFLAIDRYEGDDFTDRGYPLGYCFGPREWSRFFELCKALSVKLLVPVMPWQIPASHTPLVKDPVTSDPKIFNEQHWGTGGTHIFGDPDFNSDNINRKILDLKIKSNVIPYETVEDMFKQAKPFDWTDPAYLDFPLHGIFAVLLGGGQTTGIVSNIGNPGPWARNKLHAYMDHPISLDNLNIGSASN